MATLSDINDLSYRMSKITICNFANDKEDIKEIAVFNKAIINLPPKMFWDVVIKELLANRTITEFTFPGYGTMRKVTLHALIALNVAILPKNLFRFLKKVASAQLNLSEIDKEGFTSFHFAALTNNIELLRYPCGEDPDTLDKRGRTALQIAAYFGHEEAVKRLLECGASKNRCTSFGASAETQAVLGREIKIAALFARTDLHNYFSPLQDKIVNFEVDLKSASLEEIAPTLFYYKLRRDVGDKQNFNRLVDATGERTFLKEYCAYETTLRTLYHSWNIDWNISADENLSAPHQIFYEDDTRALSFSSFRGCFGPYFMKVMAKNTQAFIKEMAQDPHFNIKPFEELVEALSFSSNQHLVSANQLLDRHKKGKPLFINVAFKKPRHTTTKLMWKDIDVLCNRGFASRRSIEIHAFNKKLLTEELLDQQRTTMETANDFREFLFEVLPNRLQFKPLTLPFSAPMQTIGNCSWANTEAAVYTYLALYKSPVTDFHIWLLYQRLTSLENHLKMISDLDKKFTSNFEMNYKIYEQFQMYANQPPLHPILSAKIEAIQTQYPKLAEFAYTPRMT